jgi:hypothetical protein
VAGSHEKTQSPSLKHVMLQPSSDMTGAIINFVARAWSTLSNSVNSLATELTVFAGFRKRVQLPSFDRTNAERKPAAAACGLAVAGMSLVRVQAAFENGASFRIDRFPQQLSTPLGSERASVRGTSAAPELGTSECEEL